MDTAVKMMDDTTKCMICNHYHDPDVKCPICGHVGKNKQRKALSYRGAFNFSVQGFDASMVQNSETKTLNRELWSFTQLLRKRIFPNAIFDPMEDSIARHLLAFVGDAPIGIARWRLQSESGTTVVELDHLGLLESKQNKGYGKQILHHALEDIKERNMERQINPESVNVYVAESEMMGTNALLFQQFGFCPVNSTQGTCRLVLPLK